MKTSKTKIAIVDDHRLFRQGLINSLEKIPSIMVTITAENGKDLIEQLRRAESSKFPDLVFLDISMPVMNGIETTEFLKKNFPNLKILIVTMIDDNDAMLQLVKKGVNGYILKDSGIDDIVNAVEQIKASGSYFTSINTENLIKSLQKEHSIDSASLQLTWNGLTDLEKKFVRLSCSELTYAEIANEMSTNTKTIEAYRQSIFSKFNVKTRVGLALIAAKNKFV